MNHKTCILPRSPTLPFTLFFLRIIFQATNHNKNTTVKLGSLFRLILQLWKCLAQVFQCWYSLNRIYQVLNQSLIQIKYRILKNPARAVRLILLPNFKMHSLVFFLHFSAKNPSWWCKFKEFFLEKSSVKIADSTVSYTCKMNNEDSVERKNSGENIQSTVLGEILSSSIRVKRI